jgi:hypothetical protein
VVEESQFELSGDLNWRLIDQGICPNRGTRIFAIRTSHVAASERCVCGRRRAVYALPEENSSMKNTPQPATATKRNAKETVGGPTRTSTDAPKVALAKKKAVATQQKVKVPAQSGESTRGGSRKSSGSGTHKLVCRYCGSDDLAPSFIKRRDARCRACFKKRYGSAERKGAKREHA